MYPMTLDTARAEADYRREVLTRSYGSHRSTARGPRPQWNLDWMRHLQPHRPSHGVRS